MYNQSFCLYFSIGNCEVPHHLVPTVTEWIFSQNCIQKYINLMFLSLVSGYYIVTQYDFTVARDVGITRAFGRGGSTNTSSDEISELVFGCLFCTQIQYTLITDSYHEYSLWAGAGTAARFIQLDLAKCYKSTENTKRFCSAS